jgi:hypothetical protein
MRSKFENFDFLRDCQVLSNIYSSFWVSGVTPPACRPTGWKVFSAPSGLKSGQSDRKKLNGINVSLSDKINQSSLKRLRPGMQDGQDKNTILK